jgi:hypothetical protein
MISVGLQVSRRYGWASVYISKGRRHIFITPLHPILATLPSQAKRQFDKLRGPKVVGISYRTPCFLGWLGDGLAIEFGDGTVRIAHSPTIEGIVRDYLV